MAWGDNKFGMGNHHLGLKFSKSDIEQKYIEVYLGSNAAEY